MHCVRKLLILSTRMQPAPAIAFNKKVLVSLLIGLLGLMNSHAQLPAFPGAEGAGAYAIGGRKGDVYHVTTLSSSATTPGSIYYGINNAPAAGRTIVFDVSGYIHIGGTYNMANPKITIAGQTAPGDGIGFKDGTFNIIANDIIIRHIRFRDGNSADSADLGNNSNIMMDHCDVMLSNDENLSSFGTPPDNFTFQWGMNSWGMETHSCGGLWDQNHATCHHSLWSHNHTRNPKARPALLDWVNNVTFDWDIGFIMGDSTSTANWKANVRGSYFVSPPGNTHSVALEKANLMSANGLPNFSLYLDDCAMDGDGDGVLSVSKTGYALASGSYNTSATPYVNNGIPVTRDDYLTAYKKVLSAAGPLRLDASPTLPLRDELNTILVNNVVKQIRFHVNAPSKTGASNGGFGTLNSAPAPIDSDQDGMPDFWETALGSNPNLDDHTNQVPANAFIPNTPVGYTLLEEYLQFLAMPHGEVAKFLTATPSSLDIDLHKYTLGFTNKLPVTYTISNVTNGTVTLINGYLAHFVPPTNYFGRARFDFNVTDGDGSTWTQTFAVLVSASALPRDLLWKGDGTANTFDTSAANFLFGTNSTAFSLGDFVTFDDNGSTNPAINLSGSLAPGSVTINTSNNYTFSGSGSLIGGMKLNKSGSGKLTINSANSFTGGGTIDSCALVINSGGDIGTGPFTLQNATLTSTYGGTSTYTLDNLLTVPDGTTSTINLSPRMSITGLSGNGTVNLNVPGVPFNYDNLNGAFAAFTGTLNITGTVPNALLTAQFNGGGFDGNLASAEVNLDNVALIGRHNSGGNTLTVGALTGTATSGFQGSGYAGPMTLVVGGLNLDTDFAGSITSVNNTNRIVKVGSGRWTLSGSNNFTGVLIVSNGTLRVTGSDDGNIVTIPAGGTLEGTGLLKGGVAIQSGGKISPGFGIGSFGTLTVSNNLTLATPNLYFDLSGSPAGANDKITMLGGSIAMSGVNNYVFNLTDHALGAGVYNLIEGATTSTAWSGVTHNLPGNTRQTIVLNRASAGANPSFVRLTVTGSASSLVWSGTNGSAWDLNVTTNWLNGANADGFFNLDTVRFDDTSTNGNVTITGVVQPAAVLVTNTSRTYTIGGGVLGGIASLTKSGSGTLILNSSNSFTGGTVVNGGTLQLVTSGYAGGVNPITLNGGTLYLNGVGTGTTITSLGTNTLQTSGQPYASFNLQGSGVLNLNVGGGGVFSPDGDWSGFNGTINFLTGNWVRELDTVSFGSVSAVWNLGNSGGLYNKNGGATISLGALFGGTSAGLSGATTANASLTTFVIGGVNTNSVFSGAISDGGAAETAVVFNGPGSLTLNGASSYSGNTAVNAGTLIINNPTGSATGSGDLLVANGATLAGSGSVDGLVTINDGATLNPGNGNPGTFKINTGLVLGGGTILNFELGTTGDQVVVTNDLTLAGVLNISAVAGFGAGTYPLFRYGGSFALGSLTLGTKPTGYGYFISTNTPGQVNLIVTLAQFGSVNITSGGVAMNGFGGNPNANYYVLATTNLALPLANWPRVLTNQFDAAGNFLFTNTFQTNGTQQFYRLQLP